VVMEDSSFVFPVWFLLETKCSTSEPYKLDSAYVKEDAINVASLFALPFGVHWYWLRDEHM